MRSNIGLFALFTAEKQLLPLHLQCNPLPAWEIDAALGILNHIVIDTVGGCTRHSALLAATLAEPGSGCSVDNDTQHYEYDQSKQHGLIPCPSLSN